MDRIIQMNKNLKEALKLLLVDHHHNSMLMELTFKTRDLNSLNKLHMDALTNFIEACQRARIEMKFPALYKELFS